jgi:hypothetical protein
MTRTEENFGSTVPEGDDLVGVASQRDTKGTCKTKVGQFQGAVLVNEEILGFQVPVQDPARVAIVKAFDELVEIAL